MKKPLSGADIALSAVAILIPPTLVGVGQLAWSMFWPSPVAQATAPAAPVAAAVVPPVAAVAAVVPPSSADPVALGAPTIAAQEATAGPVTMSARPDRRAVQAGTATMVHVQLTLTGADRGGARSPTDLVVVLDRSGSMAGEPLDDARAATRSIIESLNPEDRFALITYDDSAAIDVPLGLASPSNRSVWLREVDGIRDGGSTNMSGGLDLGLSMLREVDAERARKVILISDGLPNAGDPTPAGLTRRARGAAERATPLTAVGVGMNFDEQLMRSLAEAGAGNYHYVADSEGLASIFTAELNQATATVASGLKLRVEQRPGLSLVSASGYPMVPTADSKGYYQEIALGPLASGQTRTLWLTYMVTAPPKAGGEIDLAGLSLTFQADGDGRLLELPDGRRVAVVADASAALASVDQATWSEAVVTEEYNLLRQQVADAVKAGDKATAEASIRDYRSRTQATNSVVGSAAVDQNLGELGWLEQQVSDSFSGEGQAYKQNAMSKGVGSSAWLSRRKGQVESAK